MKPAPQKYRTTNWKTYNEALKSRGSLLIWLDPKMNWHGQPSGKRGRIKWTHRSRQFFSEFKLRRFLSSQLVGAAP